MKGRQALAEVTDGTAALAITVVALVGARAVAVVATASQRRRRRPKRRPNLGTMAKSSAAGQDERSGELPFSRKTESSGPRSLSRESSSAWRPGKAGPVATKHRRFAQSMWRRGQRRLR